MTQIIGIICRDAIVFGAESETTCGNLKQHGTEKISIVKFLGGYAMIAESGAAAWSGSVVEAFRRKAANKKVGGELTIAKTLHEAMQEIRSQATNIIPNASPADKEKFFLQEFSSFYLTLGYYFSGKPLIFQFHPTWPFPQKPISAGFATSGMGGELVHYLLKDFPFSEIPSHPATLIAAYVLQEVKGSIQYCGGGTSIAIVSDGNKPEKMSPKEITSMETQIAQMRLVENANRLKKLNDLVESTSMQYQPGDYKYDSSIEQE